MLLIPLLNGDCDWNIVPNVTVLVCTNERYLCGITSFDSISKLNKVISDTHALSQKKDNQDMYMGGDFFYPLRYN
jgi:hypothetical protein